MTNFKRCGESWESQSFQKLEPIKLREGIPNGKSTERRKNSITKGSEIQHDFRGAGIAICKHQQNSKS